MINVCVHRGRHLVVDAVEQAPAQEGWTAHTRLVRQEVVRIECGVAGELSDDASASDHCRRLEC